MLHHFSVAVNNPHHVATVMAEIMQGQVMPFPAHPGSYMTLAGDQYGTAFEFYPLGLEIVFDPQADQAGFRQGTVMPQATSFHAAISVPISLEEIERIGEREGWPVNLCSREGLFDVIEVWVENWLLLELLTPAIAPKYLAALSPANIAELVNQFSLVEAGR